MAGDSVSFINNSAVNWAEQKVVRLRDGRLFGAAGDACQGEVLRKWLDTDCAERGPFPQLKEVWALVLNLDGTVDAI